MVTYNWARQGKSKVSAVSSLIEFTRKSLKIPQLNQIAMQLVVYGLGLQCEKTLLAISYRD